MGQRRPIRRNALSSPRHRGPPRLLRASSWCRLGPPAPQFLVLPKTRNAQRSGMPALLVSLELVFSLPCLLSLCARAFESIGNPRTVGARVAAHVRASAGEQQDTCHVIDGHVMNRRIQRSGWSDEHCVSVVYVLGHRGCDFAGGKRSAVGFKSLFSVSKGIKSKEKESDVSFKP